MSVNKVLKGWEYLLTEYTKLPKILAPAFFFRKQNVNLKGRAASG